MKLGLLVVVAAAVLLPGFSESRIVSKCELRDKLRELIQLPRRLEEGILATVICEVDRRSHLNTSLVTVFGDRIPTKPEPPVTAAPSTTRVTEMTTAATSQPTITSSANTQLLNTTTAASTATTAATATTATTATTTAASASTTTNTTTSPATTNSISSVNTTLASNSPGDGKRQKREADSSGEEENKFNEERMVHYGSQMEEEGETSTEDEPEYIMKPRSLGLYGLFHLSDKNFCDSGYRCSRNLCHTSCTAFTDDDITDDIACVVDTGHWREILGSASHSCRHASSDFFEECK